jgi:hypothetical protein
MMETIEKNTFKSKKLSDYHLYKDFFVKVIQKVISKNVKKGIEVSNNFWGGMGQRFERRKFECLKTVKGDHHLKWLGKQTATVAWDVGRCLVDVINFPATALMKGVMKLSGYTPTETGPWRTISEQSLMRQTGELVADVGAVVWDGLLLMKCSVVTTAKLVGYLGDGVETALHLFSDKGSTSPIGASVTSAPHKNSSDAQKITRIVHDMSGGQCTNQVNPGLAQIDKVGFDGITQNVVQPSCASAA